MTFPFKLVYDHFAEAIVRIGLPKDGAPLMPFVAAVEVAGGAVRRSDVLEGSEKFFSREWADAGRLDDYLARSMSVIEKSPAIADMACMAIVSEGFIKVAEADSMDELASAREKFAGVDLAQIAGAAACVTITIARPGQTVVGYLPISADRKVLYEPLDEAMVLATRNLSAAQSTTKH